MGKDRELRRSGMLRNQLPPPPPSVKGGSDSAPERKRPRRQPKEEESLAADDVDASAHVSPMKVKAVGGDGSECSEDGRRDRSLFHRQPLPLGGNDMSKSKVGLSAAAAAAGRSEVRSSEMSVEGEEAHRCLFIENVLEVVFKHVINQPGEHCLVVRRDVLNIRLVCKTWKTTLTRLYRQIRLPATFTRQAGWSPRRDHTLKKFMETMNSSQMIPVQKYIFEEGALHQKNLKMFREFLLLCGPEAVELSMTIGSSNSKRIMKNLDNLHTLELEKLKSLSLCVSSSSHDKLEGDGLVRLLKLFLRSSKTLQEVKLDFGSQVDWIRPELLVQQLSLVIAKRMPTTVKQLELRVVMNEAAFNVLAKMQSKLEKFEVRAGPEWGRTTLYKFLQSQSTTIKHLRIWPSYPRYLFSIQCPRLDELVHLHLPEGIPTITDPLNFAETFPKLNELELSGMSTENTFRTLLSTTMTAHSQSLKVLHLPDLYHDSLAPFIKNVAQSFPYLGELHVRLQQRTKAEETMREIFQHCDSLESLNILFFDEIHVDSLFSGIPEAVCNLGWLLNLGTVDLNKIRRRPSILNLTRLKNLTVSWFNHKAPRRYRFTDLSAHFAFLAMDNLREIKLFKTETEFTPKYLWLLRDKLVHRSRIGESIINLKI